MALIAVPPVVWHASRANVDRPTLGGRTVGDNHNNSGLGLFCATKAEPYISGFGDVIFKLHLIENPKVLPMTISELSQMSFQKQLGEYASRKWFEDQGAHWAKDYDVIALVEINDDVGQVIVLHDEAIVSCDKLSKEEYMMYCSSLSRSPSLRSRM